MIPEFVGRLPVISTLKNLTSDDLIRILTEPKNSLLKQYKKMFALDDVELVFSDDAIKTIASLALKRGTGARGLRSILEEVMLDIMYDIPSMKEIKKYIVTSDVVLNKIQDSKLFNQEELSDKKEKLA